jgi:hypothetical protein
MAGARRSNWLPVSASVIKAILSVFNVSGNWLVIAADFATSDVSRTCSGQYCRVHAIDLLPYFDRIDPETTDIIGQPFFMPKDCEEELPDLVTDFNRPLRLEDTFRIKVSRPYQSVRKS